ncbi:hypothetical protein [Nostoc sp. LEGE 12450]|uniref:hypothetical protein n=1 Tax=Nostoc sp. LEGE 12450 TaxID=1828643 RepID=UPI0018826751|nr:hypothetical protein [Nostoc sp. LEGE 12450]MBE8988350.1 hypothetical protein [Nostoc sp. LEGE 12450]
MAICGSQEKNEIDNELGVSYVYPKIGHRGEMSNRAESYAKELMSRFQYPDRHG